MQSKDEMDSFWDLDKLVPHKKPSSLSSFSTKEKTVTVNISGDPEEKNDRLKLTSVCESAKEGKKESLVYYPTSALIKKVTVKHVPDKFDFHSNFIKAAELYFDFSGTECDFAPFYSYMPQYTQLTQPQKNYYFYWRSMQRRGKYIKTDYSYFYLYVYEILNLPELIPAKKGIKILIDLWKNYRKTLPNIDSNMALWVQDYCLVYNVPLPMQDVKDFIFDIMSVSKFKEFYFSTYERLDADGVGSLIAYLSDYDWRRGKYAGGDNKEAYVKHLMNAMGLFMERLLESGSLGMGDGALSVREDNAFRFALTTCPIKYRVTVEYRKLSEEPEVRATVTSALKYTENKLRALLGVKSRLVVKDISPEYTAAIDGYFSQLFEKVNRERMRAQRPEYEKLYEAYSEELSSDGADEIERASWETTARLVCCDEIEAEEAECSHPCEPNAKSETAEDASYGLSDDFVRFVLFACSEDFSSMRALCESIGIYEDAVADAVNEAFFDNFGDVILENNGEGYTVISDYREDIKNWLTKTVK